MACLAAIDLGTTGCRSMVFDEQLRLLGSEYAEYGLLTPQPDYCEQDAALWWELSCRTMRAAIAQSGVPGEAIGALGISSQGISIVPVDRDYQPLRTALSWLDTRAVAEERQLLDELGLAATFARTGKRIAATYTLPKILWLQKNQPDIFAAADQFLMPLDFLTARLTGQAVTDPSMASGTLLFDIHQGVWDEAILRRYNIPAAKLARIRPCGTAVGSILPAAAKAIGLSTGCRVCVGAQDQRCASLGAGLAPGVATVSLGTAAAVCLLQKQCNPGTDMSAGWSPFVFEQTWVTEGVAGAAGASLRWLRDEIYRSPDYAAINAEAAAARERGSQVLFLPYLSGPGFPRFDPASTGCFYDVTLATTRGDFALSVMEGVAFQVREILETMAADGAMQKLILFGGGANSPIWRQIFADVLNLPVSVPENSEMAGIGAAMLAGLGTGVFSKDTLPQLPIAKTVRPSSQAAACARQYARYRWLEQRLEQGEKQ